MSQAAEHGLIRYPIDAANRASLVDAYSPGARIVRATRLRGGLGATTQVLHVELADGRRQNLVLRVYLPGRESLTPERAQREFRTIELAQTTGVPSPRPLFLDAGGEYLGRPAMLLSYLPGRSVYQPRNVEGWAEDLARAMHAIHRVTPRGFDLSWLPRFGREEIAAELLEGRDEVLALNDDVARDALAVLEAGFGEIAWPETCLIHEDFWPGNTVWSRGRLVGVIDWANAKLGDPRLDVSQCRIDALLVNGFEVSDEIGAAYERLAGQPVADAWFIDLFQGLRALRNYKIWLIGYHDAGLTFVTKALAHERIRAFLRRALTRAA